MNEKKQFLTEENYERGKKKVMRIALIILIVGVLLGGSLIVTGIIKTNEIKKQNEQAAQQVEQNAAVIQVDIDKIQAQIDQIDLDITNLQNEKSKLQNEQSKIFQEDRVFSDRYYAKDEEITAKRNEISAKQSEKSKLQSSLDDYETELWELDSGNDDTPISKYIPLYMFGGFIIVVSGMIALSIYMFGKRREIIVFTAQQVMPVAQEGIEKMAPTVGNAAGSIAQAITKGIKDGLKDNDSSNE